MRRGGARQLLDRRVVRDLVVHDDAAVSMRGVFAQTDVGDDQQTRHFALERAHRGLDGRFRIVGRRPDRILLVREPEEQYAVNALGLRRRRFLDRFVNGQLIHAGHRADFASLSLTAADEERIDEHLGREPRFSHERPHRRRPAEPSRTVREIELRATCRVSR